MVHLVEREQVENSKTKTDEKGVCGHDSGNSVFVEIGVRQEVGLRQRDARRLELRRSPQVRSDWNATTPPQRDGNEWRHGGEQLDERWLHFVAACWSVIRPADRTRDGRDGDHTWHRLARCSQCDRPSFRRLSHGTHSAHAGSRGATPGVAEPTRPPGLVQLRL
jgi:hypothetical protein